MAHWNGKTMPLAKSRYTHRLPTAKAKFCGDISGTAVGQTPFFCPYFFLLDFISPLTNLLEGCGTFE
jgi:hypothetical protein